MPGREHRHVLQLRWQGADDVDAFDGKKLAHLLEADLGLAPRHHAADGLALDLPDAFPSASVTPSRCSRALM